MKKLNLNLTWLFSLTLLLPSVTSAISLKKTEFTTRRISVNDANVDLAAVIVTFDENAAIPIVPFLPGIERCSVAGINTTLIPENVPEWAAPFLDQMMNPRNPSSSYSEPRPSETVNQEPRPLTMNIRDSLLAFIEENRAAFAKESSDGYVSPLGGSFGSKFQPNKIVAQTTEMPSQTFDSSSFFQSTFTQSSFSPGPSSYVSSTVCSGSGPCGDGGQNGGNQFEWTLDRVLELFNAFQPNDIDKVSSCLWESLRSVFHMLMVNPFELRCDDRPVFSGSMFNPFNQGPPKFLILPYTPNFISDLVASTVNVSANSASFRADKFVVVFLDKLTTMDNQEMQVSDVHNLTGLINEGRCTYSQHPIFYGKDGQRIEYQTSQPKPLPPPVCDYSELKSLITDFQGYLSDIRGASDYNKLIEIKNRIAILSSREAWLGCQTVFEKAFISEFSFYEKFSKDCTFKPGTLEYASDPCCNKTLGASTCCAPRSVRYPYKRFARIDDNYVAQYCSVSQSNIDSFLGVLNDYMAESVRINDPDRGCVAQTLRNTNSQKYGYNELWNSYSSFYQDCKNAVFGNAWFDPGQSTCSAGNYQDFSNGPVCTTDADCYTSCFKSNPSSSEGKCVVPYGNPWPAMTACFVDKINPRVKAAMMREWGLTDVSDLSAFGRNLLEKTSSQSCTGPTGCFFNGGYYKPNPQWCYMYYGQTDVNGVSVPPTDSESQLFKREVTSTFEETHMSSEYSSSSSYPGSDGKDNYYNCPPLPPPQNYTDSNGKVVYNASIYKDIMMGKYYQCYAGNMDPASLRRQGCFYVPPSQEACTAQEGCNWYTWNTYSLSPKQYCSIDRLNNGGEFCGFDNGQVAKFDASMKGGCALGNVWLSTNMKDTEEYTRVAVRCNATGGTMFIDPMDTYGYSPVQCFLSNLTSTQCLSSCLSGPNPGLQKFCVNRKISDNDKCQAFSDSNNGVWAWSYYAWDPVTYQSKIYCVLYGASPETCQSSYEEKGFSYEAISQTRLEIENELQNSCQQDFCYSPVIASQADCWAAGGEYTMTTSTDSSNNTFTYYTKDFFGNWVSYLNDNKGYCTAYSQDSSRNSPRAFCAQLAIKYPEQQWTFYQGRRVVSGKVDTQKSCEIDGLCDFNDMLAKEDCESNQYCTNWCPTCTSYSSGSSVCVHNNQTQCAIDSALWTNVNNTDMCVYTGASAVDQCKLYRGSVTYSCDSFPSDYTSCSSNPFSAYLSCYSTYMRCPNRELCEEQGYCNDWDLTDYMSSYTYDPSTGRYTNNGFLCIVPSSFDEYGNLQCGYSFREFGGSSYTRLGCGISSSKISEEQCKILGGTVERPATSRRQCESRKRCCEGSLNNCRFSSKNSTECEKCNGKMVSVYSFMGGEWKRGAMKPGKWMKRETSPLNKWSLVIDPVKLAGFVSRAVGRVVSDVLATELKCMYTSLLGNMDTIACSCGTNSDTSACIFSSGQSNNLASGSISCGEETSQSAGSSTLNFNQTQECNQTVSYDINRVISGPQSSSNSSNSTNTTALFKRHVIELYKRDDSADAKCYAYVQNKFGAFVGQMRGDCIEFLATGQVNAEICMALKSTIPYDSAEYPTNGVATVSGSGNSLKYSTTSYVPFESNNQFCITVKQSGTFCPVSLKSGFDRLTSGSRPVCELAASTLQAINTANARLVGSATSLKFSVQPGATIQSGVRFSNIEVQFLNSTNGIAEDASASVTLLVVSSGNAKVIGTPRVIAKNGIATFTDVSIDLAGTGYQLLATAGTLPAIFSDSFSVTAGAARALVFSTQPGGAVEGYAVLQQPVVSIVDLYGNVVTTRTDSITLTAAATISNTVTAVSFINGPSISATAVSGKATFTDMGLDDLNTGVSLVASAPGLASAYSNSFDVVSENGYAVKLKITSFPSEALVGEAFTNQPAVSIVDFLGNDVGSASNLISITLVGNDNAKGSLKGTSSLSAIAGEASFSGLSVDRAGAGYKLQASANGLASDITDEFTVRGPNSLVFTAQPSDDPAAPFNVSSSGTFSIGVTIKDIDDSVLTAGQFPVSIAIKKFTGATGAVISGTTQLNSQQGVANFGTLNIASPGFGYVIVASVSGISAETYPFNVLGSQNIDEKPDDTNTSSSSSKNIIDRTRDIIANATGLSPGAIAGIAIAVVVLFVVLIVLLIRRRVMAKPKKGSSANKA